MKHEPIISTPPKHKSNAGQYRNIKLLFFIIISLGLIVALPYYFLVPHEGRIRLEQYKMSIVKKRDFTITVPASGTVVAEKDTIITAPATGQIVQVNMKEGDQVEKGVPLIRLKYEELKQKQEKLTSLIRQKKNERKQLSLDHEFQLNLLKEKVADRQNELKEQISNLQACKELYQLGGLSKNQLKEKGKEIESLKKELNKLKREEKYQISKYNLKREEIELVLTDKKRELKEIEIKLNRSIVFAQSRGKLIEVLIVAGEKVEENQKLARIIDNKSLKVKAEVALRNIDFVELGQQTTINVGGQECRGEVEKVSAVASGEVVDVMVNFYEVPADLRVKTEVSVDIIVNRLKNRPALPRGRYLTSGQETYVYKIQGDKARKTRIRFGLINDKFVEVKSGLEFGDEIITSSYDDFIQHDQIDINPEGGIDI